MSDLTPLFNKYISIINENRSANESDSEIEKKVNSKKANESTTTKNVADEKTNIFMQECKDLFKSITGLQKILIPIEAQYLSDVELDEEEKDNIDTEIRLQFQKYIQKFKMLENYDKQLCLLSDEQIRVAEKVSLLNILQSNKENNVKLAYETRNQFRKGVLQSLNLLIKLVTQRFTSLQEKRLAYQNKFESLNFNETLEDTPVDHFNEIKDTEYIELNPDINISYSKTQIEDNPYEEVKHYEKTISKLTQEQIQLLETEHEELINQKNDQLKKIENINKSITDIVSIQNELALHLQNQSQNINTIMDNQDDIEVNLQEGNKQLKKAQQSASRTAKMTTYTAVCLGILILLLDYVG